jgi:outer membrane protein OmpA-like peptidoglycan-associated protein
VTAALALGPLAPGAARAQEPSATPASSASGERREGWVLNGDVMGSLLLGEPQSSLFGPGVSAAVGGYRSLSPYLLLGARLRGGAYFDKDDDDATRADRGAGGIGTLSLVGRLRPLADPEQASRARGLWIEAGGGGGVTGTLTRPIVEAGIGWGFPAGKIVIGPAVRYLHVFQSGSGKDGTDAKVLLAGVELTLVDLQPLPPAPPPPPPPALPPQPKDTDGDGILDPDDKCPTDPEDKDGFEDEDGCPDPDNDRDGIPDVDDKCPNEAEVVNGVDDTDGCPDVGVIRMIDDRIVLEERVLFETDRARVSSRGRKLLEAVVTLWKQHPEWEGMEIEGHADFRGPDDYNQRLSELRAERVKQALVKLGLEEGKLTTKGYGKTRPRAEGRSPEALQQNRRVELVVIRKVPLNKPPALEQTEPAQPPAK